MSADLWNYQFSTAVVEPPTSNQLRINAPYPYAGAAHLWIRNVTDAGIDAFVALMNIGAGVTLYVQDRNDHTSFGSFTVVGPAVDKGGYVDVPVTALAVGGLALPNNQACVLVVIAPPAPGPTPPGTGSQLLLTLDEAKHQLSITSADFDATITEKIAEASAVIVSYLKTAADPTWDPTTTPADVKAAAKLYLGHLYDHRGDEGMDQDAAVWAAIFNQLARRRVPALA